MGVSDSLAAALKRQLLTNYPASRIPTASGFASSGMNTLVARFLESVLDRHVVDELSRFSYDPSEWIPASKRAAVDESIRAARKVISDSVSIPQSRWEYFLGLAADQTCRFLVAPTDTLFAHVFTGDTESISSASARKRIRYFGAYAEILDRAAASLPSDPDALVTREGLRTSLDEIGYDIGDSVTEWDIFAEPLFSLHESVNGERLVPAERLAMLANALGREDVAERLERLAEIRGVEELSESMLVDLMAPIPEATHDDFVAEHEEATEIDPDLVGVPEDAPRSLEHGFILDETELPGGDGSNEPFSEQDTSGTANAPGAWQATSQIDASDRESDEHAVARAADSIDNARNDAPAQGVPDGATFRDSLHKQIAEQGELDLSAATPANQGIENDRPAISASTSASTPSSADRYDANRDTFQGESLKAKPMRKSSDAAASGPVPLWKQFHKKLNAPIAQDRPDTVHARVQSTTDGSPKPAAGAPHGSAPLAKPEARHATFVSTSTGASSAAGNADKVPAPHSSRPAPNSSDADQVEESVKPLWLRYRADQKPSTPSDSSPASAPDLHQLEQRVFGRTDPERRSRFVNELFGGSSDAYGQVLQQLDGAANWAGASSIIADQVFRRYRVNIYSDVAVTFTNAVEQRFLR